MESVIKQIELEIADDYKMFKNNPEVWGYSYATKVPPDRNHPDFVDMVITRCTLKHGFANGSNIAFEISNYLKGQHG
jgi:hypothetical protein